MARSGLFPTLFHRRLVLLLLLVGLMIGVLSLRLGSLSLARGGEMRAQAEAMLLRQRWIPAARGKILDRKGRILAADRPTYNIMVAYDSLAQVEAVPGGAVQVGGAGGVVQPRMTTRWARAQATRFAKRLTGTRWMDLSKAEQAERRATLLPVFEQHLALAWAELSHLTGVPQDQLDSRKAEVVASVENRYRLFVEWRIAKAIEELNAGGKPLTHDQQAVIQKYRDKDPITAAELKVISAKDAEDPIAEQETEHTIVSKVSDEVGFACIMLAQDEVDLRVPAFDAGAEDSQFLTITVPRFPGLEVEDAGDREYPYESVTVELDKSTFPGPLKADEKQIVRVDGVACHILGCVRDSVYATDETARTAFLKENPAYAQRAYLNPEAEKESNRNDRGAYRRRDRVGAAGIEFSQENVLRGLRGVQSLRIDTGEEDAVAPEDGKNLYLTLDIALQAKIQAIMDPSVGLAKVQPWQGTHSATQQPGDALVGAAVVIDIDRAEILAMVSTPTFTREQLAKDPKSIYGDDPETMVSMPGINKAIGKAYVPGSIVKAMVLTEAQTRGTIPLGHCIHCTGHLFPDRTDAFRCWIYKMSQASGSPTTHDDTFGHAPSGPEALMVSCNIYFFTLGKMLGAEGILAAYRDFGVETKYNLGIGYEHAGQLGRLPKNPKPGGERLMNMYDAIQMGIGQGPVTWTPVHAADAYATLARGGVRVPPRIIRNGPMSEPKDLGLKSDSVAEAIEGLRLSVNDRHGTGHHLPFDTGPENTFNVPGVTVWGKTGTATASPIVYDPDGDGPLPGETLESGDHSWFVVLVGKGKPQYAIAVVVDFGGSGGKVSGPIANQIIHALDAEGYFGENAGEPETKTDEKDSPANGTGQ